MVKVSQGLAVGAGGGIPQGKKTPHFTSICRDIGSEWYWFPRAWPWGLGEESRRERTLTSRAYVEILEANG